MNQPTKEAYEQFQFAFEYFKRELFDEDLPNCLITFQRKRGSKGYFCSQRFINGSGDRADEIAINPLYFAFRSDMDVLSTLVHEMVHHWQSRFGKPGRRGYHNKQWAAQMKGVGLYPSDTGEPGGYETGDRVSHYIIEGGPFEASCEALLDSGFSLAWRDGEAVHSSTLVAVARNGQNRSNRNKFSCPRCGFNSWSRPASTVICGQCLLPELAQKHPTFVPVVLPFLMRRSQ